MNSQKKSLVEQSVHKVGRFGGFSFGGQQPQGVDVYKPLPKGTTFPNGAKAAILLTFDVEGTYGNATGDMQHEISNYRKICNKLKESRIPATFNVLGQMAEQQGPEFLWWMFEAGCEVATHGYWHDLNKHYGGNRIYAGQYGFRENFEQIKKGLDIINKIMPAPVKGVRLPYGHFNEYTYDAIEQLGLQWTSNVGIDDFVVPGQGFDGAPFRMKISDKIYKSIEIPLDSQTYDWPIWIADEKTNPEFVLAVKNYCNSRNLHFQRTAEFAATIWKQRIQETIDKYSVFTLLCHPINLTVQQKNGADPIDEFLFPVIEELDSFNRKKMIWVCTCNELAEFCHQKMN